MRFRVGLAALFFLFSHSAYAFNGQRVCRNPSTATDYLLVCNRLGELLMQKQNRFEDSALPFHNVEPYLLGFPDDSTSVIYSYTKKVLARNKAHLGYAELFGIINTEAEWRYQVIVYYNMRGQVVGATARDF